jgi:hypothetical protein
MGAVVQMTKASHAPKKFGWDGGTPVHLHGNIDCLVSIGWFSPFSSKMASKHLCGSLEA